MVQRPQSPKRDEMRDKRKKVRGQGLLVFALAVLQQWTSWFQGSSCALPQHAEQPCAHSALGLDAHNPDAALPTLHSACACEKATDLQKGNG